MNAGTPRQAKGPVSLSLALALALALIVTLWMLSGTLNQSTPEQQTPENDSTQTPAPLRVLVIDSQARPIAQEIALQGQLEPWRRVRLRAQVEGQVTALPVQKGAWVEADTLLVELAEDDRPAQLARAQADVAARELEVSASETLGQRGMQAQTQTKSAQAELARARAEAKRLQLEIERLAIRAPFAGVVERRDLELGSLLQHGDDILELVDNSRLKATAQVPQQRAGALAIGQAVAVELLDGTQAQGRLIYISRVADEKTRAFRIEAEVPNPERRLASGLSIEMRVRTGEMDGHFLSPAVLTLNDQGEIGVRTLDARDRVHFVPVDLLRTESDGLWVSGLPATARIITRGQGFVSEGEQVEPVLQEKGS
ncbi:Multidrug resistance protein MexA precursor [Thiorhodovibrio winogradskyi]|uniref:Multidrug resistance protein MexA n=1 Tax=Thiorhodovibrio winogradskyi TaxID=77007 RepID=A0ABZ0SA03_9GAMM|nr:efflux RND transporter periplasmic adaptor subunit [Thiorhodovibrio winogradskyi]